VNTVFFGCAGWATYYVIFKWSNLQPLIGRRKKRSPSPVPKTKLWPDVDRWCIFKPKIPILGKFLKVLHWKMLAF
jgi:hypothetical protein